MHVTDIYTCAPGSRILAVCAQKAQANMIDTLCAAMPPAFRAGTSLNSGPIASMDITADENPSRFSDLSSLCAKLISAAGRRSHFEGLLLLNVSGLSGEPGNAMRLRALGELLAMPDGLASRCITLFYGPDSERELLSCADYLDFDGRLKVISYVQQNKLSLAELLARSALRCASPETEQLLETTLADMSDYAEFDPGRFVRSCGNARGLITDREIKALLGDPYSYINRIRKAAKLSEEKPPVRQIGFQPIR